MDNLAEIVRKFTSEAFRWMKDKMTGTISLTIHIGQGGLNDWNIQTTETKHRRK